MQAWYIAPLTPFSASEQAATSSPSTYRRLSPTRRGIEIAVRRAEYLQRRKAEVLSRAIGRRIASRLLVIRQQAHAILERKAHLIPRSGKHVDPSRIRVQNGRPQVAAIGREEELHRHPAALRVICRNLADAQVGGEFHAPEGLCPYLPPAQNLLL